MGRPPPGFNWAAELLSTPEIITRCGLPAGPTQQQQVQHQDNDVLQQLHREGLFEGIMPGPVPGQPDLW